MNKTRLATLVTIILAASVARLIPHPWNFAPITAIALFGGAYFSNRGLAFLVPMAAMFLSDLFLGFHTQLIAVYASFALIVCIGLWLQNHRTLSRTAGAALASSVLFFVVTNFGVWALDSLYPKTGAGLVTCYTLAIPFFQNALLGDLFYTAVLFGTFAVIEKLVPQLRGSSLVPTS